MLVFLLLPGCGKPTTFTVTHDGKTLAVGSKVEMHASTYAPGRRLMMHAVEPTRNVTMTVHDPTVASLKGTTLTALTPGSTDITVTGTVNGVTSTVVATLDVARPHHDDWRRLTKSIESDRVIIKEVPTRYVVRIQDQRNRNLVVQNMPLNWPPEFQAQGHVYDKIDVTVVAPTVGQLAIPGTAYHFDVVDTWDEVRWEGLPRMFTLYNQGRKIDMTFHAAKQRTPTPDKCSPGPVSLGDNPFTVHFEMNTHLEPGCIVEIDVGHQTVTYTH